MIMMLCFMITSAAIARVLAAKDDCSYPQSCGDLDGISYPFSIYQSCGLPEFRLDCRYDTSLSPNKLYAFLNTINSEFPLQVLRISADSLLVNATKMQVTAVARNCSALNNPGYGNVVLPAYPGPYLFSNSNTFMTWNCGVGMFYTGVNYLNNPDFPTFLPNDTSATGACLSDCANSRPNSCSFPSFPMKPGEGQAYTTCCSTPISQPTRGFAISANTTSNSSAPCSVSANFLFIDEYKPNSTTFPLKLDWAIPYKKSFNTAYIRSDPSFACSDNNSRIIVNSFVPGYRCACLDGFIGDGYKNSSGCRDFDECAGGTYKCDRHASCRNTQGKYVCVCKFGCHLKRQTVPLATSVVAILAVILLAIISWYKWKQRRKFLYFVNNGGFQLEALMGGGSADHAAKLYTIDELREATDNFSPSNKLGVGGYGIVYKGVLRKDNGRVVAIKRARRYSSDEAGDRQSFLNEMAILTHINHRHIVRLFGCCVETRLPLLVYEYVSNGTLAEWLRLKRGYLPWNNRVRIAIQAGSALAYLHSAAFPPILHRDVKSANILLDENMDAKVADFGASRLIPGIEQSHVSTAVQGTLGYIDPEYFQSMHLTEKSDVYSFGVVLAELLTALKPIDHERQGNNGSLAWMLISRASEGKVMEIVDPLVLQNEVGLEVEAIERATELAVRCLAMTGDKRPSMREVVEELYQMKNLDNPNPNPNENESTEPLILGELENGMLISSPNGSASFLLTGR